MNWQDLTKAQKQKAVFGLLIAGFVLAGLYQFVLVPAGARYDAQIQQRDSLRTDVERAQMMIRSEVQLDKESRALRASLDKTFSSEMPPPDNALSWASQVIHAHTRKLNLDVTAIAEESSVSSGWESPDLASRFFKPYAVRVDLLCGFEQVQNLVRSLHQSNPLVSISRLSVTAGAKDPEKQDVQLVLEWPSWRDAKQAQKPFEPAADRQKAKNKKDGNSA